MTVWVMIVPKYIIEVEGLDLEYKFIKSLHFRDWVRNMFSSRVKEQKTKTIKALKNITFNIEKGKTVGIIGENGAGKSTLFRVLAKVYAPDKGKVRIHTDSISLLSLATGFKPDLSGRENIYINGLLLGIPKTKLDEMLEDIISFSELEQFIDNPVRTYSSGMKSKLAFSIASNLDPELLLIDEVFSVGDARFRKKSSDRIKQMINADRTVIMVSHSDSLIRELCDEVIWLDKGMLVDHGETEVVMKRYQEFVKRKI